MNQHLAIQNDSARLLHEAFISNNTGTTPVELVFAILPWMCNSFVVQLLQSWGFLGAKSLLTFLVEFVVSAIPQMLWFTIGSSYVVHVSVASLIILAGIITLKIITIWYRGWCRPVSFWNCVVTNPDTTQYAFLDSMRGHLCILTCVAILAVDFQIFPRRFAKTEFTGYGLMDTGVGFFMVINGFVAPEARKKFTAVKNTGALKKSLISSIPLIVIGLIRVIAVKSLNYQEHVSEYGVHWNFFFSLAAAKIGSSIVFTFFPPIASGTVCALLAISYQVFLNLGLRDIVYYGIDGTNSRANIIDANREGLSASVGFTCLYLVGVQLGYIYFRIGITFRSWFRTIIGLIFINCTLIILAILSHHYIEPASRRLVNLTYMLWMSSFIGGMQLTWIILDLIDSLLQFYEGKRDDKFCWATASIINKSMSYNFLLCFLIANVLTGVVNISMETISASNTTALIVLTSYLFAVLATTVGCYKLKYQVKFW